MTTNTWDYRNRLTEVVIRDAEGNALTHDVFTYDVNDLRIGKSVDGVQTWTVYDQGNPYADFDASGSLTTRYLYGEGLDSLLAKMSAAGVTTWYLSDLLGSVRELVQTDGTVFDQIAYGSYGNILSETHPSQGDRLKYAGRDWDAEIGLYYNWERYVDPATGRFVSEDPTKFTAGDTNLYRYVGNTPTDRTDPTGLQDSVMLGLAGGDQQRRSEDARRNAFRDALKQAFKDHDIDMEIYRKIMDAVEGTEIDYWTKNNHCGRWANAAEKRLKEKLPIDAEMIKGTKLSIGQVGWHYDPTILNLFAIWVDSHMAIKVQFPDGRFFYFDDGNWGGMFRPGEVPDYAHPPGQ